MKRNIDETMRDGVTVYKSILFEAFMGVSEAFRSGEEAAIHDACDWFLSFTNTHVKDNKDWQREDAQARRTNNPNEYWDPEGPLPKECWRKRMAVLVHYLSKSGVLWTQKAEISDESDDIRQAMAILGGRRHGEVEA